MEAGVPQHILDAADGHAQAFVRTEVGVLALPVHDHDAAVGAEGGVEFFEVIYLVFDVHEGVHQQDDVNLAALQARVVGQGTAGIQPDAEVLGQLQVANRAENVHQAIGDLDGDHPVGVGR